MYEDWHSCLMLQVQSTVSRLNSLREFAVLIIACGGLRVEKTIMVTPKAITLHRISGPDVANSGLLVLGITCRGLFHRRKQDVDRDLP